ncbi:unnamed protein product, partial [Prorocentrum cordatum]
VCGGRLRVPGPAPPELFLERSPPRLPLWSPAAASGGGSYATRPQESSERTCTTVVGRDILGDALGSAMVGQTAEGCRGHCLEESSCGCYSFDPSRNGTCWLKRKPCNELLVWTETEDMTSGSCRDMRPKVCTRVKGKDVNSDLLIIGRGADEVH